MTIGTAQHAALLVPLFSDGLRKKVVAAHLDGDLRLIGTSEGKNGSRDQVDLPIRSIIKEALHLDPEGLIVAQNHPSGDPRPSE